MASTNPLSSQEKNNNHQLNKTEISNAALYASITAVAIGALIIAVGAGAYFGLPHLQQTLSSPLLQNLQFAGKWLMIGGGGLVLGANITPGFALVNVLNTKKIMPNRVAFKKGPITDHASELRRILNSIPSAKPFMDIFLPLGPFNQVKSGSGENQQAMFHQGYAEGQQLRSKLPAASQASISVADLKKLKIEDLQKLNVVDQPTINRKLIELQQAAWIVAGKIFYINSGNEQNKAFAAGLLFGVYHSSEQEKFTFGTHGPETILSFNANYKQIADYADAMYAKCVIS